MVSKERLNQLKAQIEDANALGVTNLAEKGVVVAENATTYDIMEGIAKVSGGSTPYPRTWFTFEANVEPTGSVERID